VRTQLTKRIVTQAQPQERPYELRDTLVRGLILRVQPSGYKAWIIEWTRGKRRTLGPFGHLTLDQARSHAQQTAAEYIQQGLPSIARQKPLSKPLGAFLDEDYLPWARVELRRGHGYVERMRMVFSAYLDTPIGDLTPALVDQWWRDRLAAPGGRGGRPVTKATAARDLACLRGALSKAVELGLMARNPLFGLRQKSAPSRKVVRYLSPDEEGRLRAALVRRDGYMVAARTSGNRWRTLRGDDLYAELPPGGYGDHLTPVVLLGMNTGLRRGELLSLLWSDVDLESNMLTVRAENAKTGRQRHVPLNAEAQSVLKKWAEQSGRAGQIFTVADVKTAWGGLLESARIEQFRFHVLRHHFASKLVRAGVDLNTVRELLGHSDIKMTLRYSHLSPDGLAAAVAKLEQ
jgi:integrase